MNLDKGDDCEVRGRRGGALRGVTTALAIALAVVAAIRELRTPRAERTGHGVVAGFVPYDFRAPTFERIKSGMWLPEDPHLLVPTIFGVGWTINLARLLGFIRSVLGHLQSASGDRS